MGSQQIYAILLMQLDKTFVPPSRSHVRVPEAVDEEPMYEVDVVMGFFSQILVKSVMLSELLGVDSREKEIFMGI